MNLRLIPLVVAALMMGGCASMTGLTDSNSKFACKAPDGVSCTSVSGVYANAQQNNLPALQPRARGATPSVAMPIGGAAFPVLVPGMPIRSQARMLRIWVAPWRDEEDTLHDQSYMYVMVDPGKWLIERSRDASVQKTMIRLQPLGKPRTAATAQAEQSAAQPGTQLTSVRNNADAQASAREAAVVPGQSEEIK